MLLVLAGRDGDAGRIFKGAVEKRNDVGLLSEQFSTHAERFVGNFPQVLSHLSLITAAFAVEKGKDVPVLKRRR